MILKVKSREELVAGLTRYDLNNGWTIYRGRGRSMHGNRYEVYAPAQPHATFIGGSNTLKGALEVATARQEAADANLTRMAFGGEFR